MVEEDMVTGYLMDGFNELWMPLFYPLFTHVFGTVQLAEYKKQV